MNVLQYASAARHLLTAAGSVVAVVAIFNPTWGHTAQVVIGGLGTILAGVSTITGVFSPVKTAATGLTGAEAASALNKASLQKARTGSVG